MEGFGGVMEGATGLGGFDGVIERFGGVIEVATELGDFDGVIECFDGAIERATVPYRRCHKRFDGARRFRRCH